MRMTRKKRHLRKPQQDIHLAGNFWERVGAAFTDPEQRFEFPIKAFEMDFTKESKNAMYATASIVAIGAIITAYVLTTKD